MDEHSYIECGDKATNAHACLLPFQVEFSLFLTPAELGDRHRCWQLFTERVKDIANVIMSQPCLLYTSPSPRDATLSRMPSSA